MKYMLADKLNGHHLLAPCKGSLMQTPHKGELAARPAGGVASQPGDLAYV